MPRASLGGDAQLEEFCGTTQAAKMLGVSVGTVHGLVDRGELSAWKTLGGHRRIAKKSILDYQVRHQMVNQGAGEGLFRVAVALQDSDTLATLKSSFANANANANLGADARLNWVFFDSAMDMQMELQQINPRLLMLDVASLATIGGFDWLRAFRTHERHKHVAVMLLGKKQDHNTPLIQGQALSYQIKLLDLPLDVAWLKGYLDALM